MKMKECHMNEKLALIAVMSICGLMAYGECYPFYANEIRTIAPAPGVAALAQQYGDTSMLWGFFAAEPSTSGIRYVYEKKEKDGKCIGVAKIETLKFRYKEKSLVWSYWGNFDEDVDQYKKISCKTCRSRWNNLKADGITMRGDKYIEWHENKHKNAFINWNERNSDGKGMSANLKQLEGAGETRIKAVNDLESKIEKKIANSISKDYRTKVIDEVHNTIGATFPVDQNGHEHGFK